MRLRCPKCGEALDPAFRCVRGHAYSDRSGVLRLMTADFAGRADRLDQALTAHLAGAKDGRLLPADFAGLPGTAAGRGLPAWRGRVVDLALIRRHIGSRSRQKFLDVGAWNGWLSEALSRDGHTVVAVSCFGADGHGLATRARFAAPAWRAIQLDEAHLDVIDEAFDAVILNRCLHTALDSAARLRSALARTRPGGVVIATGLPVVADLRRLAAALAARERSFELRHGVPLMLAPGKDWLDTAEASALVRAGLRLRPYPGLRHTAIASALFPARPVLRYGILARPLLA
ncbi:MAG: methyltransferase domain-containing protein [Thermoflexales bacterium]